MRDTNVGPSLRPYPPLPGARGQMRSTLAYVMDPMRVATLLAGEQDCPPLPPAGEGWGEGESHFPEAVAGCIANRAPRTSPMPSNCH